MSEKLEEQLRRALRPVQPPDGFVDRVMRALPERRVIASVTSLATMRADRAPSRWRQLSAPAALAASLLVAVFLGQHMASERTRRDDLAGIAASRELMQALRVTSQKLDIAYQAVKTPPPADADAQENRS